MSSPHTIRAIRLIIACVVAILLGSCAGIQYRYGADTASPAAARAAPYPAARFAVFSDPHLFDARFAEDVDEHRLLRESSELLAAAIQRVEGLSVSFLLIPGDLTRDGELQGHLVMARQLAGLARTGVRVYVVPGNHDILNPHAARFTAAGKEHVPSVTPASFAEIYANCGYGDALMRDPGSLSYVAEPVPGLWLLAVDSASYAGNMSRGVSATGGGLTQERIDWIETVCAEAQRRDKGVIVMMHHGVLEHFAGQAKYFGDYLVNGWQQVSRMLAAWNVRAVFTGHFHAQDIVEKKTTSGQFLYDIETGSLVSFPNPVRVVEITGDQKMVITSSFIKDLPSFSARGIDFWTYSRNRLAAGIARTVAGMMTGVGISQKEAAFIAQQVADASLAHFRGDEVFTGTEMLSTSGVGPVAGMAAASRRDLVEGLWRDTAPADNDVTLDLAPAGAPDR
jgi:3',5'-cyclic AMP phosphodiesterase CpdA